MIPLKSKLYKALFFLFSIQAIGVVGYMLLSDSNFIDALYMTVITISTVGFREVHPLDNYEKIFTIFLILTSLSLFGYAVSAFTEALASGEFFKQLKRKKVEREIDKLKESYNCLWLWKKWYASNSETKKLSRKICSGRKR